MKFSVLMSLYDKEQPQLYFKCLQSIVDQTLAPNEVIIVHDGFINDSLINVEKFFQNKVPMQIIQLNKNKGLGIALNVGLNYCSHELVIRCDTDDISLSTRFEKQVNYMVMHPDIDVVSGVIAEYEENANRHTGYRKLPLTHNDIVKFSRYRSPVNHMASVYRKRAVLAVGSYKKLYRLEDYFLWIRMILNGSKFANLEDLLVIAKAGGGLITRRGGMKYFLSECRLFSFMLVNNHIPLSVYMISLTARFFIRVSPPIFRKKIYKSILRNNKSREIYDKQRQQPS